MRDSLKSRFTHFLRSCPSPIAPLSSGLAIAALIVLPLGAAVGFVLFARQSVESFKEPFNDWLRHAIKQPADDSKLDNTPVLAEQLPSASRLHSAVDESLAEHLPA